MFGLEKIVSKIEIPPQGVDADLAIPSFRENPLLLAEKIKALQNPLFADVSVAGRYVNIRFNRERLAPMVLGDVLAQKEKYGWNADGAGKTVMIEYSSPNIAKPMHMGHARNNAIGHALKNIYEANGYAVITANYIGDWGMSIAKIICAYEKWKDEIEFNKDPIRHLLSLYVRMTKEIEKNPALEDEARALFKKLADGDAALRALWQKLCALSIVNFKRVYALLGIDFDLWNGESFYEQYVGAAVQEALDKGVATREEDGPAVVNLDQYKLPSFLLTKSDGASLYGARDLAVAQWRLKNYAVEKIIYVVGHEQELYLKQIFKTLALMGYPEEKFAHVSYGVVTLDGKKIATRSGNIIFLEDGLHEAIKRAKDIPEVGIGAVVFNMVSAGREHDIAFSWESALAVQGNSAPYIQYGFVRAMGILKKAGIASGILEKSGIPHSVLETSNFKFNAFTPHEIQLLKMMAHFPQVVRSARAFHAPHYIATYLNALTQEFNRFYATTTVLAGEQDAQQGRLALTAAVAQVIKNGLWLIGIKVPNAM